VLLQALGKSIVEWRQNTTLLPMIQLTPLPFPYYHLMILLMLLFELVVGIKMALHSGERADDEQRQYLASGSTLDLDRSPAGIVTFFVFFSMSLVVQSLVWVSILLLDPWGKDALDLPVEEYLMLPWVGHRKLFSKHGRESHSAEMPSAHSAFRSSPRWRPHERRESDVAAHPVWATPDHQWQRADRHAAPTGRLSWRVASDGDAGTDGGDAGAEGDKGAGAGKQSDDDDDQPMRLPSPVLLPMGFAPHAHQRSHGDAVRRRSSIFLTPYHTTDEKELQHFKDKSETVRGRQLIHETFRDLEIGSRQNSERELY